MTSFLKKLFGGGAKTNAANSNGQKVIDKTVYEGFEIKTLEMKADGQYRVCAEIAKEIGEETKTHTLIRADICGTPEEASNLAMHKAQQMIKEQGERIFR